MSQAKNRSRQAVMKLDKMWKPPSCQVAELDKAPGLSVCSRWTGPKLSSWGLGRGDP